MKARKSAKAETAKNAKVIKTVRLRDLLKQSWLELSTFWRQLAGITLVYAGLYLLLVMGFSIAANFQSTVSNSGDSRLAQASTALTDTFIILFGGSQSDATTLVQSLLFVIGTLALVWALRKLQALKKITIRDAFYQGNAQLLPVVLVSVLLLLTAVPALLGSTLFSIGLQAGGNAVELIAIGAVSVALLFLSAYLFTKYWPSFYIASLPKMRPLQALKSASALTKGRRLSILRKLLFLTILIITLFLLVMIPFALSFASLVPYGMFVLYFVLYLYVQVYLYELYRSLLP